MRHAILAIAILLLPSLVLAQAETTGRVTGTVVDEEHQPIKNADITLESPALQGQRKSTTDVNGRYLVSLLPAGVYTMTVNAPGKSPVQYTFRVGVGQQVPIDATLKAGEKLTENVTVLAPAAKMETTQGGENFNLDTTIRQLPIPVRQGTDYLATITNLAPNVSDSTFTRNTLIISGAPSYDNSYLLDGADISDPFYSGGTPIYIEEAIQEVQVITNGVSARYGRFQGGVVNVTTKSGGNTFDGSVRVDVNKQTWNQRSPYVSPDGQRDPQSDTLNSVYSGTFGGPIMKDHLWFFLGGRTIPVLSQSHNTVDVGLPVQPSITQDQNETRYQGKLTGAINANHTIEASFLKYDATIKPYDGLLASAETTAVDPERKDPRKYFTADYHGVLNDRTFLGVQYAQKDVSIIAGGDPSRPSPIMEYFEGEYKQFANGWWDPNDPSVRNNKSASFDMTHALATGSWGDHTLEYGIQYVDSITAGDNRQSPTGYNLYFGTNVNTPLPFHDCSTGTCFFNMDPSRWFYERLKALPGAGTQDMKNLAAYVQDAWEFHHWRVDLGVRWENWKGQAISSAMNLDFNEISPRIGVTYNITPDWQLQATWGKYVSRFNDGVSNNVTGISSIYGPGILQEYSGPVLLHQTEQQVDALLRDDANWGAILGFVDPRQPTTFFAHDIGAPYANDLNLSVKRALPKNYGVVTLTYTKRDFKDLLESYKGGQGNIDVTPSGGGAPIPVNIFTWANCGECLRDYEALSAVVDFRPSAKWNIGGNYTYAKLRGNYEGEAASQPAIGSIIGDYPLTVDANLAYPYGYLKGDIRHRVRLWGNYRFDFGRAGHFSIGPLFNYQSGNDYSLNARVNAGTFPPSPPNPPPPADYSGAPSSYQGFFGGRGTQRFSGQWHLDTTFKYDVPFYKDFGMYVKFDIVNITNQSALILYRTGGSAAPNEAGVLAFTPSATFGTPTNGTIGYQTPRSYYVSLGVNF